MKKILFCLLVQLLLKVASSEWMLGVHIHSFKNNLNVEIRDNKYCCCDVPNLCNETFSDWKITYSDSCLLVCDTYFMVYFQNCSNLTCTTINTWDFSNETSQSLLFLAFPIPSMQLNVSQCPFKMQLLVEAWDNDEGESNTPENNIIDNATFPITDELTNPGQLNLYIAEGRQGIGSFTLVFVTYNSTTDISGCSSVDNDNPTSNLSTPIPLGSTTQMYPNVNDVMNTSLLSPMVTTSSCFDHVFSTLTASSICSPSTSTMTMCSWSAFMISTITSSFPIPTISITASPQEADTIWIVIAISSTVVAILLALTSIALMAILCNTRKSIKPVVADSDLTQHQELVTMTEATTNGHHVPLCETLSTLKDETQAESDSLYNTQSRTTTKQPSMEMSETDLSNSAIISTANNEEASTMSPATSGAIVNNPAYNPLDKNTEGQVATMTTMNGDADVDNPKYNALNNNDDDDSMDQHVYTAACSYTKVFQTPKYEEDCSRQPWEALYDMPTGKEDIAALSEGTRFHL